MLSLDLSKFANKSEAKLNQIARKVFIDISTDIIRKSPVRTGRFRSNWMPEINKFSTETTESTESASSSIAKVVNSTKGFKIGMSLTLSNSLPYAMALEYGHSKQAPSGVLRTSFAKANRWVKLETAMAQKFTWSS